MKFIVMAVDECGDDFYVDEIKVPQTEDMSREECEEFAEFVLLKRMDEYQDRYPEARNFHLERPFSDMSFSELRAYSEMMEAYGEW